MCKSWILALLSGIVALVMLVGVTRAADQQTIKVGKKGQIVLDKETKVGDATLMAGTYQIQHRVEGADHIVVFNSRMGMKPIEVKCKLEPLQKKASETAMFLNTADGGPRIVRIEIAGENVAHVF